MELIDGSAVHFSEKLGGMVEDKFMTYSEEEKQQNEVNASNAKLVFSPEFIPYRMSIKKSFELSHVETLLYGFIRFYKGTSSNRFYFTNEQLAEILDCSEPTIENSMSNLVKKGIVSTSHKIKAGGGKIRFVESVYIEGSLEPQKIRVRNPRKLGGKENKLKENTNIDGVKNSRKKKLIVDNFKITSYEEQKLVEWAGFLGGDNLGYLVGKYRKGQFWAMEVAIGNMKELDLEKVGDKGKYFNKLVEEVVSRK